MNTHLKKPQMETRCSHGGIAHGTPEYRAVIERAQAAQFSSPSLKEISRRKYEMMLASQHDEPTPVPERKVKAPAAKKPKAPTVYERTCVMCPTVFTTNLYNKLTCSDPCSKKRNTQMSNRNYVRRPVVVRTFTCDQCGNEFPTTADHAHLCSGPCRNRWHYNNAKKRNGGGE